MAAEEGREISGNQRREPGQLAGNAPVPSPQDFKKNQDDGKRNEYQLPEGRTGRLGKFWIHQFFFSPAGLNLPGTDWKT